MSSPAGSIWFQGDWSDPWVEGVVSALPRASGIRRIDAASDWPTEPTPPDLLILHRARLLARDAERFADWKRESAWRTFPHAILCHGPYARYAELERWLSLVDVAIPEATAFDSLPRRVEWTLGIGQLELADFCDESARVVVVSRNADLRRTLGDACAEWVPRIVALPSIGNGPRGGPESELSASVSGLTVTIIDAPLLEADWELQVERASRLGPVIVLFCFPDRSTVDLAARSGAWACLELPFDRDDLGYALMRCLRGGRAAKPTSHPGFEPGHQLPRPPSSFRIANPKRPLRHDA